MGMAASQARYLGLTARKTNTEYEGQQVNQERTALANQSAGLFNQMLALDVPTPPNATDYTKTEYVFTDYTTSESYTVNSILPNKDSDTYTVHYTKKQPEILANKANYKADGTGTNRFIFTEDDKNKGVYTIQFAGNSPKTISGPVQAPALTEDFKETDPENENINDDAYYFKFSDTATGTEYYILAASGEETAEEMVNRINAAGSLDIYSAESTTRDVMDFSNDAILTSAGDGTGRWSKITFTNADGTLVTCSLTQQTTQDEDAYNAAMETYQAKKDIYEKQVADINAKTTIIQQQDKTLELHLDQLDTEQQAIQTELDAVKKVIDKNIEETFKTFA